MKPDFTLIWMCAEKLYEEFCQSTVRGTFAEQNYLFHLAAVLLMAFVVAIFGKYGANYVASAFIYEQF